MSRGRREEGVHFLVWHRSEVVVFINIIFIVYNTKKRERSERLLCMQVML